MSRDEVVAKIVVRFSKYNPKLIVVSVTRYGCIYLIIAVYNVSKSLGEMVPFYLYYPLIAGVVFLLCIWIPDILKMKNNKQKLKFEQEKRKYQ